MARVNAGAVAGHVTFYTSGDTAYQQGLLQKYWPDSLTISPLLIIS
jgi:hypothetical protein